MDLPRSGHTATLLTDGRVLIAGGYNGEYLATAEVYDPASNTWRTISMASPRSNHTATLLQDGRVLVTGGSNSRNLTTAEVYTPGPL
jgi:N-acetylneuraminic acid mutarotase